ncbi:OmpA family protein [Confluentibacter flavum]|uniref:Flagellar motor protein MotB n=1 Tax=Confluentibacter flavum TaxID=1909700 RepID=A0A2N3HLH9_9FLAO|nr:OmpA family protein [Confluentibacter flavum]PKQ45797.1 flagellar motor protein MotB [Confluentibacter flavum]
MNRHIYFIVMFLNCLIVFSQKELKQEVYFETDKYDIPTTEESRLLLFISKLSDLDIESISIYGFCDDVGAPAYNLKLSQQRADAIKAVFADNEISESLISNVDGKGQILLRIVEEKDVVKIRGLNRKVEIIVKEKASIVKEETPIVEEKKKDAAELIKGDIKVGDKIIFENLLFKTGYTILMPESKKVLENIAKSLEERNDVYFTIQGHVCCTQYSRDAVDRKTKKQNLSEARAKFVYDFFVKKGIEKKRMRYVGMRRKFPLGGDPELDRRVEILITHVDESLNVK